MKTLIRPALAIAAVVVLVRLAYLLTLTGGSISSPLLMVDSHAYVRIATNLTEGAGYSLTPHNPTAWREPGYPAILASFFSLAGPKPAVVGLFQVVLQGAAALLTGLLAFRLLGRVAAIAAMSLFAVSPALIRVSGFIITEPIYLTLLTASVLVFLAAMEAGTFRAALAAGLLFGATALVREVTLLVAALLLTGWLVQRIRARSRLWLPFLSGVMILLLVAPWIARNYAAFGRLLPLHVHGGLGPYLAYHPTCDFYDGCPSGRPDHLDFVSHFDTNDGVQALRYQETLITAAKANIASDPKRALRQAGTHVIATWGPSPETVEAAFGSTLLFRLLRVYHWIILLLALAGTWLLPRGRRWVFVLVILSYPVAGGILSGGHHRYVVPVMPLMLVASGAAVAAAADRLGWLKRRPALSFQQS